MTWWIGASRWQYLKKFYLERSLEIGSTKYGDPLSPYLFIIMIETLGRSLKEATKKGELIGINLEKTRSYYSHHQFVDDTILLGKAKDNEAIKFKQILFMYERASHQKVNIQKTKLYVLNSSMRNKKKLDNIKGF